MNATVKMVLVGAVVGAAAFFVGNRMGRTEAQTGAPKADAVETRAKPKADEAAALARARKRIHELESELAAMRAAATKKTVMETPVEEIGRASCRERV